MICGIVKDCIADDLSTLKYNCKIFTPPFFHKRKTYIAKYIQTWRHTSLDSSTNKRTNGSLWRKEDVSPKIALTLCSWYQFQNITWEGGEEIPDPIPMKVPLFVMFKTTFNKSNYSKAHHQNGSKLFHLFFLSRCPWHLLHRKTLVTKFNDFFGINILFLIIMVHKLANTIVTKTCYQWFHISS